ncbi:protein Niban 1-like [Centroberyx affinis]|uniref:protein Niban 1-like n=1 Tax=Centroberyx affinis TaxID=166261 RepID=UPI003A5BCBEC
MGASSSGLLDEAKVSHIKGLADSALQNFGVFYRQQYSAAHTTHLHQEVEPKKEGRGLLLTHRPRYAAEEVLYQGSVQFSCWEEQGKKCKDRYTVLRGDYTLEIHDSMEAFSRGTAAKLVLRPAGGAVLTTEEKSRALLEQTCAGILNGVKEDSSSVVPPPGAFPVYLHLPHTGHACFLFAQEEQRDRFLSALKTCIRHQNLDPWCGSSYESQAFVRALRLYRQDKGCYESWEMLLGAEEKVLASQVMEEVLPWLQSQLQSRVKGKKTERIRQWMATVQATYTLVLEQLTDGLEALKGACRQTASANQAVVRSNLDQIMASRRFLEDKLRARICDPAEKLCSDSITPYLSSILEALTECISGGIQGIQHTLHTQMDAALTHTHGGAEGLEKALSTLRSTSLDHCYKLVENLAEKLQDLKQRFRLTSTQRLVHSAHLEMEQLLDSAVYTLELFLQSSARRQPAQIPVNMERAKERVLKQLDHDSRVVQRRLYQEALLEITLPALTRDMDNTWKPELKQFEEYIFSDYSSFILVHNVYDDVLRDILSKEIEKVVQEAAKQRSNHLLLDSSDLAISQYSLLGHTPPRSAPSSPAVRATRDSSSAVPDEGRESASPVEDGSQSGAADVCPRPDPDPESNPDSCRGSGPSAVLPSPVIVVTQQSDESSVPVASVFVEPCEEVQPGTDTTAAVVPDSAAPVSDADTTHLSGTPDLPAVPESPALSPISPNPSDPLPSAPLPTVAPSECVEGDEPDPPAAAGVNGTPDLPAVPESPALSPICPNPSDPLPSTVAPSEYVQGDQPDPPAAAGVSGTPDLPAVPESPALSPICPNPSDPLPSTVAPSECVQGDQPDPPAASTKADLPASDVTPEADSPLQSSSSSPPLSHSPCTESPLRTSLASLSEAVGCIATATTVRQATDRAVYLRGGRAEERVEGEGEAAEEGKEVVESEGREENEGVDEEEEREAGNGRKEEEKEKEEEREEGQMEGVGEAQAGGEPVDHGCSSSESPAESATASSQTTDQREEEEKGDHEENGGQLEKEQREGDEEEEEEKGDREEKGVKAEEEEEGLQSAQPMASQPETAAELPLDSISVIRGLVTEVIEVETLVSPNPHSNHTA